jgi:hypothetical protein
MTLCRKLTCTNVKKPVRERPRRFSYPFFRTSCSMNEQRPDCNEFDWREILFVLAVAALAFQVFPSLWSKILWAIDVRNWSPNTWLYLNIAILLTLVGVRFGSHVYVDFRERRLRNTKRSQQHRRAAENRRSCAGDSDSDVDFERRLRRDAEWRERAKKRLPWH